MNSVKGLLKADMQPPPMVWFRLAAARERGVRIVTRAALGATGQTADRLLPGAPLLLQPRAVQPPAVAAVVRSGDS